MEATLLVVLSYRRAVYEKLVSLSIIHTWNVSNTNTFGS